jgi:hypothetical protein
MSQTVQPLFLLTRFGYANIRPPLRPRYVKNHRAAALV